MQGTVQASAEVGEESMRVAKEVARRVQEGQEGLARRLDLGKKTQGLWGWVRGGGWRGERERICEEEEVADYAE